MQQVLKDIWKDKPTLIAIVAFLVLVLYIVYKNSQGSAVVAPAGGTASNASAGAAQTYPAAPAYGTFVEESYNSNVTNPPASSSPVATVTNAVANIRGRFTNPNYSAYDNAQPAGVPIRNAPGGLIVGYAPYGSQITLSASGLTSGPSNLPSGASGGSNQWVQTASGWISAGDLTGGTF